MLKHRIREDTKQIAVLRSEIPRLEAVLARRVDTRGDQFRMQVDGRLYNERAQAARALAGRAAAVLNAPRWDSAEQAVGQLGGFELTAKRQYRDDKPYVLVDVVGVPVDGIAISTGDIENAAPGLVVRFENALGSLDRKLTAKQDWIDELATEITRAEGELGKPFQHQDALHAAYTTRKAINDQLAAVAAPLPAPAVVSADPDVAASLGVLAATHAPPVPGHRQGHHPETGQRYRPGSNDLAPAPELD